jgi:hypothetical protein
MDDQDVANWVGAVALALVLAALGWLVVSPGPGAGGGDEVRVSGRQGSWVVSPHLRPLDQMQRCVAAAGALGVSGCVAGPSTPSASPTPSDRSTPRSTSRGEVGVTPSPAEVPAPSAPASLPPAQPQPSSSPPPPVPTRLRVPHSGPVPGGNTSPPHTGPRP